MLFSMRSYVILIAFALVLAGCSKQPVAPESGEPDIYTSPYDEREYRTLTLENGLRVLLVSDTETEKAAAALAVGAGSMQNPDSQLGLAHFLEHMLFLGTEKYPDPDEYSEFMSRHGGTHNAYTADDLTNYMFEINNDALPEALDRFSDFFKAPLFTAEYVEKEVNAVNSEWSMQRANDGFILFALNNRTLNPDHPIARFRIGNNESLGDKPDSNLLEAMVEFYERYYSANLMTAVVLGNRSLDELEQLARGSFSDIPNFDAAVDPITAPPVTEAQNQQLIYYKPQVETRTLLLDFTIPEVSEYFANKPQGLVSYLISSEMPGTPAALLREGGLIESLSAWGEANNYGNAGRVRVALELTEQGYAQKELVLGLLFRYFDMLRETGVDEAYVSELRTVLNNEFQFLRKQEAFGYVSQLAAAMQEVPTQHAIDADYRLDSFNAEVTQSVLEAVRPENARIFVVAPDVETDQQMHFFDGQYRIADLSNEMIQSWKDMAAQVPINLPAVNRLLPEDLSLVTGEVQAQPQTIIDEPGLSLLYQRSERFEEPRASVFVDFYQPTFEWSYEERVAASMLLDAFNLSERGFSREAGIAGVGFSLSFGQGLQLRLNGFNDKQAELANMLLTRFVEFEMTAEQFAMVQDRQRRSIMNELVARPLNRLFPAYQRSVRPDFLSHQQRLARVMSIQPELLNTVKAKLLGDVSVRALVYGNHTAEDATALVRDAANFVTPSAEITYQEHTPIREFGSDFPLSYQNNTQLDDSAVLQAHFVEDESIQARLSMQLLSELLHTRFFNQLRTEEQLGYAVGVTNLSLQENPGLAMYIQSPVRGPAPLVDRFNAFIDDATTFVAELEDQRFEETKTALRSSLEQPPQSLGEEAGLVVSEWRREEPNYNRREESLAALDQLTKAQLQTYFTTLVAGDHAARNQVRIEFRGANFTDIPFSATEQWTQMPVNAGTE
ncbi:MULTISPECIES: insulinase family protein [Gammaproteobacteria]|uniref:insulinase family protein n=1 Tax=Gammaproteobacteria TaxID=1236 RepID=UPI000DD0E705|nr:MULTISPECIES: insulinase family protein [Gammaproteobacteria]RTE86439.1 hypothetical protein DQX04_07740 [Aliidiomarina sp. B3213]TCZ91006.1 hypothetical protein EYQ95_09305 [Lysobacter sp. N42]